MEQKEREQTRMEQIKMEQQSTERTALSSYSDLLIIGGHAFTSRFILGLGKYPLDLIQTTVKQAEAQIITPALRRVDEGGIVNILDYMPSHVTLLPNTSGARNTQEAVRIARLSREAGCGDFVKIEVVRDAKYLLPDNTEIIKATETLVKGGFVVMPYMHPDLNTVRDLASAGVACIIPLAAPIGTNRGLCIREFIQVLINEIDLPIIVDAEIGRPLQTYKAVGMDTTAITANTAIATAGSVPAMAGALKLVIEAGRQAYPAGLGKTLDKEASVSSLLTGFLHN